MLGPCVPTAHTDRPFSSNSSGLMSWPLIMTYQLDWIKRHLEDQWRLCKVGLSVWWRHDFVMYIWTLTPSFLVLFPCSASQPQWTKHLCSPMAFCHDVSISETADYGLNPPKPWVKLNSWRFRVWASGTMPQWHESWQIQMCSFLTSESEPLVMRVWGLVALLTLLSFTNSLNRTAAGHMGHVMNVLTKSFWTSRKFYTDLKIYFLITLVML